MLKKFILYSFGFLLSSFTQAQTGEFSGRVLFEDEGQIAAIQLIGNTKISTPTDLNGYFTLAPLPAGEHIIKIISLGFKTKFIRIEIAENQKVFREIELEENPLSLDEAVVSGTLRPVSKAESPVPVEVYTAQFFQANPTPSLFESMQNINGVRPQLNCNVCNTGDIHINGLEGPYTLILIDGMPIVSGLATVYGLTGIPQSLIERIEIVKGPASALYGSEAVGGLINIITKNPSSAPLFSADILGSSWGEVNTDLGWKYSKPKKFDLLTGVNYFNYSFPIDNNKDGFTDITLQNRFSIFEKINFHRANNKLFSLAGRYVWEDRWGGQMNWTPEFRGGDSIYGESIRTNRWEVMGVYELGTTENVVLQWSANGHNQDSYYGTTAYSADQYIGFAQLLWYPESKGRHSWLMGAAYRYTYYDDNTAATAGASLDLNQPSQIHLPGLFAQDEWSLDDQHTLLTALRIDHNPQHGFIPSPRINYKWNSLDKKQVLRFGVGNGFRVVNVFAEDHAALTGARRVEFAGNLNPETSWNANLNFIQKFITKKDAFLSIDASLFYTHFSNRILPDYDSDPNKIIYANLNGSSVSKGLSIQLESMSASGFSTSVGATLMDVRVFEDAGNFRQFLTESFSGVWSIGYLFHTLPIKLDYTGNVYGPMRLPLLGALDSRAAESPWWNLQNIQLTYYAKGGWEYYGGIKNLLNFTPPANSIARAFDPFDKGVEFDSNGQVIATEQNPEALSFDPTYVFAPNQGIRGFVGIRYRIK